MTPSRRPHVLTDFHHRNTDTKGTQTMNHAKRSRMIQSKGAGVFAALRAVFRFSGGSAPSLGRVAALGCLALAGLLLLPIPALAANTMPWWHLTSGSRPSNLAPDSKGELVLTAANLGTAPADSRLEPIVIEDSLPAGLKALSAEAIAGESEVAAANGNRGKVECSTTAHLVTCTYAGSFVAFGSGITLPKTLPPFDTIEVRIKVLALESAQSGEANEVAVSGGGALAKQLSKPIVLSEEATAFGLEDNELAYEGPTGAPLTQAGAHPFQQTVTLTVDQDPATLTKGIYEAHVPALVKDVHTNLPQGFVGDPSPLPRCSLGDFLTSPHGGGLSQNACPADTAVGATIVSVEEPGILGLDTFSVPVFNLEPALGEPARFGFSLPATKVVIDTALRSGFGPGGEEPEYDISASATNLSQTAALLSSQLTFWGAPGDPRHDESRGWGCIGESLGLPYQEACKPSPQTGPAFLRLPTSCAGPLRSDTEAASWPEPHNLLDYQAFPAPGTLDGCNQLPFSPTVESEPTSNAATAGTGLSFDLNFSNEGLTNSKEGALAESDLKKAVVTLPQGFTSNPSVAEGLKACAEAEYKAATVEVGSGCTPESKIGEVEIESPLVEGKKVSGGLFVAKQGENPYHNLLTLYMIARNEELGVLVRQALKVTPDPVTGQLTAEVDKVPQIPFSKFHLQFRSGQRSPLITPAACGEYAVKAKLYSWAQPNSPVEPKATPFQITQGPEGQPCPPGGLPPFKPDLIAGSLNNAAGAFSPFYARITRKDSEQEITHFSIKLPPGVVGKLAGIPFCSDAAILAAKAREREGGGQEELESPSCPQASEVGHTLVGAGVGNVLAYAPGRLYLAGPYNGAPISIVSITAAKVGPFDLGTVVVREALRVNPETAEVFVDATGSDPIPHIVDGIPVHLKDIRIYVNRPEFVLNPTSCERTSTASTVLGAGLNFASEADDVPVTVTSPFQAADCAALPFKPKLSLKLVGSTKRTGHPALKATLKMNGIGEAAISKSQVALPKSEFLDQGHLNNICTRVQFKEGNGNGEKCPPASIYGFARAKTPILSEPLEGPVFLRSSEHNLPDLVAALHAQEINVDLVGRIDSLHGQIRNTFETVPDAPVESFTLEMQGGAKGLLVNSTNLCEGIHRAIVDFTAHSGKVSDTTPAVGAKCSARKHKGKRKHKRARRHR